MIDYINLRLGSFEKHVGTVNGLNSTLSLLQTHVENNVPTLPVSASDVIMSNSEVLEENIATYLPTIPNTLSTFTTNVLPDKPKNSLFNYFSEEDCSDPIVSVFNNSGTDVIFNINKKSIFC
jgi:hypothetical protein